MFFQMQWSLGQSVSEGVFLILCRTFRDTRWAQSAQILIDISEMAWTGLVMFVQRERDGVWRIRNISSIS